MIRYKIVAVITIVTVSLLSIFIIRSRFHTKFLEREASLRAQRAQLIQATAEQRHLSNLAAVVKVPAEDRTLELIKLRGELETLRRETNRLTGHSASSEAAKAVKRLPSSEPHKEEYWKRLNEMAGGKTTDALKLATAFLQYTSDHQKESPSNIDQLNSYLGKTGFSLSGTNQFEIVYQGSFVSLEGIPITSVAVIRDVQTWAGPDGNTMRVYGMADGHSEIVGGNEDIESWEAKHVIAPPRKGEGGQDK